MGRSSGLSELVKWGGGESHLVEGKGDREFPT